MNTPRCFTRVMILDPKTNKPVSPESWKPASSDQVKAVEWVAIKNTDYGFVFLLHKNEPDTRMPHPAATEFANNYHARLGKRIEWITIYNAIYTAGLNKLLESIGGDVIRNAFYWTEELDEDPRSWEKDESGQSYAAYAWHFHGTTGNLYTGSARFNCYASRLLRAL